MDFKGCSFRSSCKVDSGIEQFIGARQGVLTTFVLLVGYKIFIA